MDLKEEVLTIGKNSLPVLISKTSEWPQVCCIEIHGGVEGNKEETAKGSRELISYCEKKDYLYMTYDPLNNGSRSDGSPSGVLFTARVDELTKLTEYVRDTYSCPVILVGSSLGGLVVINAAYESQADIVGLVINCGVVNPEEVLRTLLGDEGFNSWKTKGSANVFGLNLPYAFLSDINRLNTGEKLAKLTMPILWFHGTEDKIVPIKQVTDIQSKNKRITVIPVKNGGHRFGDKMQPGEWERKVEDFISILISA